MEPTGGDLAGHDHEFDEVRWIPFDEAADAADVRDRASARRPGRRSSSRPGRSRSRLVTDEPDGLAGRADDPARRAPRARSAPG